MPTMPAPGPPWPTVSRHRRRTGEYAIWCRAKRTFCPQTAFVHPSPIKRFLPKGPSMLGGPVPELCVWAGWYYSPKPEAAANSYLANAGRMYRARAGSQP
jgi:hypothetical protein